MNNIKIHQRLVRSTPPGPRGFPLVEILPLVIRDPLANLVNAARRYGGVVCLGSYLPGRRVILISRPEPLKYVLQERASSYTLANAFVTSRVGLVLGKGITFLTGEPWLQRRRLLQPAFHRDHHAHYVSTITNKTAALVEQWRSPAARGEVRDISVEMSKIVRATISKWIILTL
jgi:cytochrome P450